jgi:hypothetical protein
MTCCDNDRTTGNKIYATAGGNMPVQKVAHAHALLIVMQKIFLSSVRGDRVTFRFAGGGGGWGV